MLIQEQVNLKSRILISESDANFIKNVSLYIINCFEGRFDDALKEARVRSYLYKNLNTQSCNCLIEDNGAYISDKILSEGLQNTNIVKGYINSQMTENCSKRNIIEENIVVYVPILHEWVCEYLKTSKDSNHKRGILKAAKIVTKEAADKKMIILKGMGI